MSKVGDSDSLLRTHDVGRRNPAQHLSSKTWPQKKDTSIKNQNMKINFWNHEVFTTYTTHAICFLGVEQATDQATTHAKAQAKALTV